MAIKPLNQKVIIKAEVEEQRGSIVLARMSRQLPDRGVVMAISAKAEQQLEIVHVGTRVIFDRHHQQFDEYENTSTIDAQHILAVIE